MLTLPRRPPSTSGQRSRSLGSWNEHVNIAFLRISSTKWIDLHQTKTKMIIGPILHMPSNILFTSRNASLLRQLSVSLAVCHTPHTFLTLIVNGGVWAKPPRKSNLMHTPSMTVHPTCKHCLAHSTLHSTTSSNTFHHRQSDTHKFFDVCFYPHDTMLARVFARATCPSVCLSHAGIVLK